MDTTGMETVYVPLWQNFVKRYPHEKVLLADVLGADLKTQMQHLLQLWPMPLLLLPTQKSR